MVSEDDTIRQRREEIAFANVAVGGYFRGARPYRDRHGIEHRGVFSMEALIDGSGWAWAIPLHDGTLSVGVVVHRDIYKDRRKAVPSLEEYFAKTLELSPDVTMTLASRIARTMGLMVTVAGFYCQIRNQEALVLPSVSRDNFQLAFDLIQPVVSGNADVNSDEIPPEVLGRAMRYTTATMLEIHDIQTNVRVAKLLSTRIMDESITDRFAAVDAMYIRFQRGQLGLEWLGALGSMLLGA